MKKLLFLLFGVIFALAGCADESGTNGGNTETCPITSADFSYERIAQNKYKMKLIDESKRQYARGVYWEEGRNTGGFISEPYNIEPLIEYLKGGAKKEVIFYYNNNQCGETIILKPKSTYNKCDDIQIEYYQNATYGTNQSVIFIVEYDNTFDISLKTSLSFDNGLIQEQNAPSGINAHQFVIPYNSIKELKIGTYIYADVIIEFPNNTECVKELKYYIK